VETQLGVSNTHKRSNDDQKQINTQLKSSRTFDRTPGGRKTETTMKMLRGTEKARAFDPVAQE
jgi:hypothetical protein